MEKVKKEFSLSCPFKAAVMCAQVETLCNQQPPNKLQIKNHADVWDFFLGHTNIKVSSHPLFFPKMAR